MECKERKREIVTTCVLKINKHRSKTLNSKRGFISVIIATTNHNGMIKIKNYFINHHREIRL